MSGVAGIMRLALAWALGACACVAVGQPADSGLRPFLQLETGHHAAPVRRIAIDSAGALVVTASDDKTARVWSARSGELLRILRPPIGPDAAGKLYGAAIHPLRPLVALGGSTGPDHSIYLFDLETGRMLRRLAARGGDVKRLLWSPDGSLLAAVFEGDHGLRVFDPDGTLVFEERYAGGSYGVAFASDMLATVARDGLLRTYRVAGSAITPLARIPTTARDPLGVALAPDGKRAAVAYSTTGIGAEVVDLAGGRVLHRLTTPQLTHRENLSAIAWSADGGTIVAGGRAGFGPRAFYLAAFDAMTGQPLGQPVVASDSILDLAALRDGRIGYATFAGGWGIARPAAQAEAGAGETVNDFRGAAHLKISDDARRVSFAFDSGDNRATFDLRERHLATGEGAGVSAPRARAGLFSGGPTGWENEQAPLVNGARIALEAGEVSRAIVLARDGGEAFLGTSRALLRIGPKGEVLWRRPVAFEVRAVNLSADARLLVTAMSDGTVRWWRAHDGVQLLALLPARDRRWVLFTPSGVFDASAGADTLVGWHVNRGSDTAADFYSLGRFRERFQRPEEIDRVLDAGFEPPPAPVAVDELPPALAASTNPEIEAPPGPIDLAFLLHSAAPEREIVLEVRADGRPLPVIGLTLPERLDGKTVGTVRVNVPAHGALLQLVARNQFGYSEPLAFHYRPRIEPPAASAPPPLPTLYLLAVGVARYARADYRLDLPAKDARDFAATMKAQEGRLYAKVEVRMLLDEHATRAAIERELAWLSGVADARDVGMLFLAGHGINDQRSGYHFLPHDGAHDQLARTAVPEPRIREALRAIRGKAVMFVDTCHAGGTVDRLGSTLASAENGVIVFASSTGKQLSQERREWGNGAFTKAVLAGLAGAADRSGRGRVTFKALYEFVFAQVEALTRRLQTPVAVIPRGIGDFPLAVF